MYEMIEIDKDEWVIGKIKFYSIEKKFGYVYFGIGHWNDEEFYFNSNAVDGIVSEDDFVCFKFEKRGSKIFVTEIKVIDKEFISKNYQDFNPYLKSLLIQYLSLFPKSILTEIENFSNQFDESISELMYSPHFKSEYLDITEFLNDFTLSLEINYREKVGEDTYLWIGYNIKHPKFENCNFNDLTSFKNPILYEIGYQGIFQLRDDFEQNQKAEYEEKIPDLLLKIKEELIRDFHIRKTSDYKLCLKRKFTDEIINSIFENGWLKTEENLDLVFLKFREKAIKPNFFNYRYWLVKKI